MKNTGRGNKLEIPVYNRPGDIVSGNLPKGKKQFQIHLIAFIGHVLVRGNIYVRKKEQYYVTERWFAMAEDNDVKIYSVTSILGDRIDNTYTGLEESSLEDRPYGDYPDNTYEVNLLQDRYEDYLDNKRTLQPNFHLRLVRNRHELRLFRLKHLASFEENRKMKEGYLLHLMQKETPTLRGMRLYEEWCLTNPLLFTKLKENVYQTVNSVLS